MAFWKSFDGWNYEYFSSDISPATLEGFEDILTLWHKKRGTRRFPAWADFDFYDFKGWHGKINMATIQYDPFSYVYQLFGTESTEKLGGEWTGKSSDEINSNIDFPDEDMEFYEMACRSGYITRMSGSLPYVGASTRPAVFVEFPLSDNGETVTHTLEVTL